MKNAEHPFSIESEECTQPRIAIVGAGPAGLEASVFCADNGILVTLFDKNTEPGGMIPYGFSPWHNKDPYLSRMKEVVANHPNITFLPHTILGKDITVDQLRLSYQAVIIATGIQEERQPEIPGVDSLYGKGLVRHMDFRFAFTKAARLGNWRTFPEALLDERLLINQKQHVTDEVAWEEWLFTFMNGAIIPGGGRASMEVAKSLVTWCVAQKLWLQGGIDIDPVDIEKRGVYAILRQHNIDSLEALGIKSPVILHWKGIEHMTLFSHAGTGKSAERIAQANRCCTEQLKSEFGIQIEQWTTMQGVTCSTDGMIESVQAQTTPSEYDSSGVSQKIFFSHLVIPTLGTVPVTMHAQEGFFMTGAAAGSIGGIHAIRREARHVAKEVIRYMQESKGFHLAK